LQRYFSVYSQTNSTREIPGNTKLESRESSLSENQSERFSDIMSPGNEIKLLSASIAMRCTMIHLDPFFSSRRPIATVSRGLDPRANCPSFPLPPTNYPSAIVWRSAARVDRFSTTEISGYTNVNKYIAAIPAAPVAHTLSARVT